MNYDEDDYDAWAWRNVKKVIIKEKIPENKITSRIPKPRTWKDLTDRRR